MPKTLRILQIVTRFDFGGAENYVRELSNELVKQNHDVYVISRHGRQVKLLDKKVHYTHIANNLLLIRIAHLLYVVTKYKIQVIHAHQRLPILSACIVGWALRIPVVVTVHGRVRHDLRSSLARKIPSKIIFVSKRVLTVSRYFDQLSSKSVIIPNGIPKPQASPAPIKRCIGYISRLDARHTAVLIMLMEIIPKLAEEFPGVKLSIVGDGKNILHLKGKASKINSQLGYDAISIHGFIADLLHLKESPELILGVGRVAIEAAMRGISVISVNYKRMGKIFTAENYLYLCENNFVDVNGLPPTTESLYDEIYHFLKNRARYREDSKGLLDSVVANFDISSTTNRIVEVYTSAIK